MFVKQKTIIKTGAGQTIRHMSGMSATPHPSYTTRIVWYNISPLHQKGCLLKHAHLSQKVISITAHPSHTTRIAWYNITLVCPIDCRVEHTPLIPQGESCITHPSYTTRSVWYTTPLLHPPRVGGPFCYISLNIRDKFPARVVLCHKKSKNIFL